MVVNYKIYRAILLLRYQITSIGQVISLGCLTHHGGDSVGGGADGQVSMFNYFN